MQRATTLIMQQVLRQRMQCLVSNSRLPVATFTHHHQQQQHRYTATSTVTSKQATPPPRHDWNRAVSEAERIVGYPTSFLSLRWLLSDEIANVALHLRKLVGSAHPLKKTAKHLLYNGKNTMQAWGLIVLLVSKAGGHAANIPDVEQDKSAGVLHSQRALAEVTEMIRISRLVHNSVVNLQSGTQAGQDGTTFDDMSFGNKIGLLTGDYLLGHSSAKLANLRNQEVVELISSAVRDFSESEFIGERDEQNNPLPFKPGTFQRPWLGVGVDFNEHDVHAPMPIGQVMGNPEQEWECRNILNAGSLLGKSCQASLKLAQQSEEMQRHAYRFGKHLALAWQACLDAEIFQTPTLPLDAQFSLVSAPVLFHLEHDPSMYALLEKGKQTVENIDYHKIHKIVIAGPALAKTKELQCKHTAAALTVLQHFPATDARQALENIILAMQDL
ncbi:all trans-polyprenyl-diphosphate synthase PDSS2-like [Drosophila sulfurigaster albostrigata]|uniref:all trans-polyprenyl-diphosphate synthase PDSS2-like n=1 Tax=Drosophila sulfurigaster albostrigata TaxID=89887 RepID=UPI002D21CC44|nr:all trans-polyprenyl-diphosphate synthase PDSS2-like [Drosophila sulfurigaster albostrigata]